MVIRRAIARHRLPAPRQGPCGHYVHLWPSQSRTIHPQFGTTTTEDNYITQSCVGEFIESYYCLEYNQLITMMEHVHWHSLQDGRTDRLTGKCVNVGLHGRRGRRAVQWYDDAFTLVLMFYQLKVLHTHTMF